MEAFTQVTGKAAPLLAANIDTDIIIPKQFLKGIDRQGLAEGVFFDLRFNKDGSKNPEFILNKNGWDNCTFLIVGPNFGCGSSREHAVWGLRQLGIRALIGTSFAGIFNDNCQRNGILTINLGENELGRLATMSQDTNKNTFTVNLEEERIDTDEFYIDFIIDDFKKEMLINGLDAVGYTLQYSNDIINFEKKYFSNNPWMKL